VQVPISFPIPLAEAAGGEAHYLNPLETEESEEGASPVPACTGGIEQPTAEPGALCVYTDRSPNFGGGFIFGPNECFCGYVSAGTILFLSQGGSEGEVAVADGAWAVTAPEP